jgi:hypothetical protein
MTGYMQCHGEPIRIVDKVIRDNFGLKMCISTELKEIEVSDSSCIVYLNYLLKKLESMTCYKNGEMTVFCDAAPCSFIEEPRSSVSVVSDYGPETGRSGFDPWKRQKDLLLTCVQTGSGAHPASCTAGTGGPFPGDTGR